MDNRRKTSQPRGRGAVGLLDNPMWNPFFEACNKEGLTNLPQSALDQGLYVETDSMGEVKFDRSGRPQTRLAPEIESAIKNIWENALAAGYDQNQLLTLMGEYGLGVPGPKLREARRCIKELLKPAPSNRANPQLRIVQGGLPETNRRKF